MAAFYTPAVLTEGGKDLFAVDKPCLILQNKDGVWISDPAQKGGVLQMTISGTLRTLDLPADGSTIKAKP